MRDCLLFSKSSYSPLSQLISMLFIGPLAYVELRRRVLLKNRNTQKQNVLKFAESGLVKGRLGYGLT